ncbi:hypothetical protein BH23VER1_BH23VER1_16430 [soil metagenome]
MKIRLPHSVAPVYYLVALSVLAGCKREQPGDPTSDESGESARRVENHGPAASDNERAPQGPGLRSTGTHSEQERSVALAYAATPWCFGSLVPESAIGSLYKDHTGYDEEREERISYLGFRVPPAKAADFADALVEHWNSIERVPSKDRVSYAKVRVASSDDPRSNPDGYGKEWNLHDHIITGLNRAPPSLAEAFGKPSRINTISQPSASWLQPDQYVNINAETGFAIFIRSDERFTQANERLQRLQRKTE